MKKIILVPALLGVMGIGGLVALGDGNIIGSANSSDILTKSEIEKKALKEVDGKITELEYEKEGLKSFYEVEVTTSDAEYDLLFDAQTGELLKKQKKTFRNKVKSGDGNITDSANSSGILSKSEIEKKALKEVDGKITDLEYEKEGLKSYYEVEVTTSDAEYDLLFDAQTGELLKKHKETNDDDDWYDDDDDDRYDD